MSGTLKWLLIAGGAVVVLQLTGMVNLFGSSKLGTTTKRTSSKSGTSGSGTPWYEQLGRGLGSFFSGLKSEDDDSGSGDGDSYSYVDNGDGYSYAED